MSLPDVSFTNNLGTLAFKRSLIAVTDTWEFNGRVARHVKSISIDGHFNQNEAATLDGILTNRTQDGKRYGDVGVLTLPWTTLQKIRLAELQVPTNIWIDSIPVQATFVDDFPDHNTYTVSFFGITIYNPRIAMNIPERQLRDEYPKMPLVMLAPLTSLNPRAGVFRNRSGQKNIDISLTGVIRVTDNQLPPNIISLFTQRANMTPGQGVTFAIPSGYPRPFNLGDAIPEIKNDLNLAHVIITGSTINWRVEEQVANININMTCPPQIMQRR